VRACRVWHARGAGVQIPSAPISISAGQTVLIILTAPHGPLVRLSGHRTALSRRRSPRRRSHRVLAQRDRRRPHYLRSTLAGTQAAQADAHVRLIGRVSSAWWWPGMKLMTNGPSLRPYLLPGGWWRYCGGHRWISDAAAHMKGRDVRRARRWLVEGQPQAGDAEVGDD
jgi:hypothetical protein